jgi:hypothetical protein
MARSSAGATRLAMQDTFLPKMVSGERWIRHDEFDGAWGGSDLALVPHQGGCATEADGTYKILAPKFFITYS